MNANEKIVEPRSGDSSLVRPRYTPGLMLQDDDLTQAVTYTRELNRLLFRSLLGCGVICGLVVKPQWNCGKLTITVAPGVALDCSGDALQVTSPQTFVLDPSCKPLPKSLCIVIRYRERSCLPRTSSCGQDDDGSNPATRIKEGYELRILSECPDCGCGCESVMGTTISSPTAPARGTPAVALTGKKTKRNTVLLEETAAPPQTATPAAAASDCRCIDMSDIDHPACYSDHYKAICSCCTDCEWVTLARVFLDANSKEPNWLVDHSVRRLIRPVLMRDWQAEQDQKAALPPPAPPAPAPAPVIPA